jgi:hypothetical protein
MNLILLANDSFDMTDMSALTDNEFILINWQRLSRYAFGAEAEAKVAEQRDEFREIGENELWWHVWRGIQMGLAESSQQTNRDELATASSALS